MEYSSGFRMHECPRAGATLYLPLNTGLPFHFFVADPMYAPDVRTCVHPSFSMEIFHFPATAEDWTDYVSRFDGVPEPNHVDLDVFTNCPVLVMSVRQPPGSWPPMTEVCLLSWLDIWVLFCLARGVPLARAVQGPCGGWDLTDEFPVRRVIFGL